MAKSDSQQYKFREISVEPQIVNNFSNEDRLSYSQLKQSDELINLLDALNDKIKSLIDSRLTFRQKQIVEMVYFKNMTQTDIAKELGLCQPTIHKVLLGNLDYCHNKKRYGGAIKKLQKLCSADSEIANIVHQITRLKVELME